MRIPKASINKFESSLWVLWQSRVPRLSPTLNPATQQADNAGWLTKWWKVMSKIYIFCSTAACWHDDTQCTPAAKGTPYAKRSVTKPHLSKLIQAHMQRKNVPSHMDELKSHKLQFFKDLSKIGSPIPSKCAYSKPKIVATAYHK